MSQYTLISLVGEKVKVLRCKKRGDVLTVLELITLTGDDLDGYLQSEKASHLHIVFLPSESYQEILHIPPVKKNMLKPLIDSEVKKRFPDIRDQKYYYEVLGERTVDGKRLLEVFVFCISPEVIVPIIERVHRANKFIAGIYPASLFIATLFMDHSMSSNEPFMGVFEYGDNKVMVIFKEGKIVFIRDTKSYSEGLQDLDVQTINMTINYCRQTFRFLPRQVVLSGSCCENVESSVDFQAPVLCLNRVKNVIAPQDISPDDALIPSSFIRGTDFLSKIDFMPQKYRDQYKRVSHYRLLVLLSYIALAASVMYGSYKTVEVFIKDTEIDSLRQEVVRSGNLLNEFEKKNQDVIKLRGLIDYANKRGSQVNIGDVLLFISNIDLFGTESVNLGNLVIKPKDASVNITLDGTLPSRSYLNTYKTFNRLLDQIKTNKQAQIVSSRLEIHTGKFSIELNYKDAPSTGAIN